MVLTEKKIFENIPKELRASWVVSYLSTDKFTPRHVKILRTKTNAGDKRLSSILSIAPKTFVSYTKDVSKIKIDTKEHILLLISLLKHGADVFGSEDGFNNWLDTKNVFLDNKNPLDLLNTISGIRFVDDRLVAMEYGDNV